MHILAKQYCLLVQVCEGALQSNSD
uniref:Uncharacterized protein n=1 Tax=Anguilla anguilla TaxID=7936 RepID=A0A0E9TGK9_ANGAN